MLSAWLRGYVLARRKPILGRVLYGLDLSAHDVSRLKARSCPTLGPNDLTEFERVLLAAGLQRPNPRSQASADNRSVLIDSRSLHRAGHPTR